MTDFVPFPNKRLRGTELFTDNNRSLLYVFVYKPIHRNHKNTCDHIMKGMCAMHFLEYCIMLQLNIDL